MLAAADDSQAGLPWRSARDPIHAFRLITVVLALLALAACAGPGRKRTPRQGTEGGSPKPPAFPASGPGALATTGGTLVGEVVFEGQSPAPEPVSMDSDPFCQEAQRRPAHTENVEVNSNRTLKNVFVYAREGVRGSYAVPTEPVILDQRGCRLSPHVFGIRVGQPLRIVNSDATNHNMHFFSRINGEFNPGQTMGGFQKTTRFEAAEVPVRLGCDLHQWMTAYAGVLPHPYFAVTNGAGAFEIKGLLPGVYVIGAWQEKYGLQTRAVTISGEELETVNFTFREGHS